jgi:hypothetical protein
METYSEPITPTRTVSTLLLVMCTLAYMGAVALGVSLALGAIQSLVSLPCAMPFLPRSLPCA